MTVPAVEAFAADVMEVTELNRLLHELILPREPGRSHQGQQEPADQCDEAQDANETRPGNRVCTLREELTHRRRREAPIAYIELSRECTPSSSQVPGSRFLRARRIDRANLGNLREVLTSRRASHVPVRRYNVKYFTISG